MLWSASVDGRREITSVLAASKQIKHSEYKYSYWICILCHCTYLITR